MARCEAAQTKAAEAGTLSACSCCSAIAEVVVFHHALGLTDAVRRFADALRDAGHTVHTPDLSDGRTVAQLEDDLAYSERQLRLPPTCLDAPA